MSEPSEVNDARRLELIAAAQRQWVDALTDLGGRNTLLYYKDRRAGTLDLASADPDVLERFEKTGRARLTKLFTDADERADAIRRMQTIYRKSRELTEERGIRAGYLATGLARWDELFLEPAAPVLLRGLTITPTRARYDDFDLTLEDDVEVNPVLLHKLASVFGAVVDKPAPDRIAGQLAKAAANAEVPGFTIEKRKVIGTFTYAKLPMVRDLEAAGDLLADSDLVAAIAGDPVAQQLVSAAPDADEPPRTDDPEDDYSVLDADSSQRSAIETVLAGRSLVIHGPPGTGKSQTIANLIAAMVARGRKVLFVAEKRAAIDAVLSRLVGVGLGELVLDIHEGTRDRQRIAAGLGATLDLAEHATAPDTTALHRRLTDRQQRLRRHAAALHRVHEPWRLSAYQVQSALLGVPPAGAGRRPAARPRTDHARARRGDPRRAARVHPPRRLHAAPRQHPLVRRHPAHPRRGARGRRAGGHPVRQDAAEAGCPAGRRVQGNRSAPRLCQLSGTYAAYSPLPPPPRGGSARPWLPRAARAAQGGEGGVDRARRGRRRRRRTAAAVGLPGAGPRVAGSRTAAGRAGGVRTASRARRGPGEGVGRAGGGRGNPVAAAPAARAGPPLRRPRPRPAARRDRLGRGHPRRARGRVRLRVVPHDPGPHPDHATSTTTPSTASPSTRSPRSSALATSSTWPRTAPGCAARGPGSCGTRSTSTRCRPG